MCLDEQAVCTYGYTGFGYRFNQLRHAACDTAGLVGLLQGMGNVQYNGKTESLHLRYSAIIHHKILIAESCSAFCNHYVLVAGFHHLVCRKTHGKRGEELTFFDIDDFTGLGGGYQ